MQVFRLGGAILTLLLISQVAGSSQQPPSSGQQRRATLRELARAKGFVWETSIPEDRRLRTFSDLVDRSDLVIRGRVVGERVRLSPDEYQVLTDYFIEVIEVYKGPTQEVPPGTKLLVSRPGGNLLIEGNPIRVDTPNFPPVSWIAPHIMFLRRSTYSGEQYHFTGLSMGVVPVVQGKVTCKVPDQERHPATKVLCGKTVEEFSTLLRERLSGQSPQPRP